ncbi:MAG: hypothetical protein C0616_09475 [Desulfuromonas sp.]|nr:MAG: hypothetical protein C0616_09475 [Desulfuromonas sp.]
MKKLLSWTTLISIAVLLAACTTTSVIGSWSSPTFKGKISKVYVIGVARQETNRRIFEDEFSRQLAVNGARGIPSYRDIPASRNADKEVIAAKARAKGADTLLITRATGKRTEEVVNPGRVTTYDYGPRHYNRRDYHPAPYYRNFGDYYTRSREVIVEPATVTTFKIVTVEANLYDASTSELVWSAQLETALEGSMEGMITDFVTTVIDDIKSKGLL